MLRTLTILLALAFALPAAAQNAYHDGWSDHNVACFGRNATDGLSTLHDIISRQVVNTQEVYGVSSFWNDNHGNDGPGDFCDVIYPERSWTSSSSQANEWGVWGWHQVGFLGYIVTDRWLVPVDVIGFRRERIYVESRRREMSFGDQIGVRAARIYDRRQFDLSPACYSLGAITIDGVPVYGLRDAAVDIVDRYGNQQFRISFCRSLVRRR